MTWASRSGVSTVVDKRLVPASLRQYIDSGNSNNTNSYNLTLPRTPDGQYPLFLAFAVEDATTTISSITTTGTTWSRLYRDTTHGDGIELWAAPAGATGTGVSVSMSGTQWSSCVAMELSYVQPTLLAQSTVSYTTSPSTVYSPARGAGVIIYRRADSGGSPAVFVATGTDPETFTVPMLNGNNTTVLLAPLVSTSYEVTAPTTTDVGVSIAVLNSA